MGLARQRHLKKKKKKFLVVYMCNVNVFRNVVLRLGAIIMTRKGVVITHSTHSVQFPTPFDDLFVIKIRLVHPGCPNNKPLTVLCM